MGRDENHNQRYCESLRLQCQAERESPFSATRLTDASHELFTTRQRHPPRAETIGPASERTARMSSRSIRPRVLKNGRPPCVELGMARAGAAGLIQPCLAIAILTPAGFCPKHCGTGLTQDWYRTAYILSLDGRVLLGTNVLSCWRVERPDEQKPVEHPRATLDGHCGATLNGHRGVTLTLYSLYTRVYHRIPAAYTLLPISLVFCRPEWV